MRTGKIRGFEALIRWDHHRRGLLTPEEFLEFAEDSGQIHQIGEWVLETALRRHRDVLDITPAGEELEIAVNVSPRQIENESFADDVVRIIGHSGVPPHRVTLEITETAVMNAPRQAIEPLRDLGIRIAVDDFGTGYSSLASLDRLPVDVLKVDKVFVAGMSETQDTSPLISTIVGLSQWLGLDTVVEGIETRWQLDRLRALGCNIGQGYLFSPPVPPATMMSLARRQGGGEILFDVGTSHRQLRSVDSPEDPAASA